MLLVPCLMSCPPWAAHDSQFCSKHWQFARQRDISNSGLLNSIFRTKRNLLKKYKKYVAEGSFDLPTSGLWAQHASAAPLC